MSTHNPTPINPPPVRAKSALDPVLSRRVALTAAAWSVPAVVATVSTPAFAASGDQLIFNKSSYTGKGCSSITGNAITVRGANGAGRGGVSVTVTLAGGFTFSDGSTSHTGVSNGSGVVNIPDIPVPASGGSGTLSATAAGVSTSVGVSGTATVGGPGVVINGRAGLVGGVSFDSVPVWGTIFLQTNGDLVTNGGTVLASNVVATGEGSYWSNGDWYLPFRWADGGPGAVINGVAGLVGGVAYDSKPVWGTIFLQPNGDLVTNGGTVIASSVASIGAGAYWSDGKWYLPFQWADGGPGVVINGVAGLVGGVAYHSTPVWGAVFRQPNGDLVTNGGQVLVSNVKTTGVGTFWSDGNWYLPFQWADGGPGVLINGSPSLVGGVAYNSAPIWATMFLQANGDLVTNGGTVFASNVARASSGTFWSDGKWYLPYAWRTTSC